MPVAVVLLAEFVGDDNHVDVVSGLLCRLLSTGTIGRAAGSCRAAFAFRTELGRIGGVSGAPFDSVS